MFVAIVLAKLFVSNSFRVVGLTSTLISLPAAIAKAFSTPANLVAISSRSANLLT